VKGDRAHLPLRRTFVFSTCAVLWSLKFEGLCEIIKINKSPTFRLETLTTGTCDGGAQIFYMMTTMILTVVATLGLDCAMLETSLRGTLIETEKRDAMGSIMTSVKVSYARWPP
jgi:hypothetical protein